MDKVKDAQLARDLINGDPGAFDILYYRYQEGVLANIQKFIHHPDMAEDILQEVFITLWENRAKLDASQSVAGWLFVVSQNKSLKQLKISLRERAVTATDQLLYDIPESENGDELADLQWSLLRDAIDNLPPRKKQVFDLCGIQGKSHREASEILGISDLTVKEHMKISYKFIREYVYKRDEALYLLFTVFILKGL